MKTAILNTSIITMPGDYSLKVIDLETAKNIIINNPDGIDSAVGHEGTAQILTDLFGMPIPMNRQIFAQAEGQEAIVFKLNGRPPEGVILSKEEIEEIGYKLMLLKRIA